MTIVPSRLVIITGAPGSGKTETARRLVAHCPQPVAWLDTDWLVQISPWHVDDDLYRLIGHNLRACIDGYRAWGASTIIVSGVVLPEGTLRELTGLLADATLDIRIYALRASVEVLLDRIGGDRKDQDAAQRARWTGLNDLVFSIGSATIIETGDRGIDEVVAEILRHERGTSRGPRVDRSRDEIAVPLHDVRTASIAALERAGLQAAIASRVLDELLDAEASGQPSHGLQRVPEYVQAIDGEVIVATALPQVRQITPQSSLVVGHRAPMPLLHSAIVDESARILAQHAVAAVGLVRGSHIGRFGAIARRIAAGGRIVVGFGNYSGAGQLVPAWFGSEGRLCTNPLVFAFPGRNEPVVIDMSTSVVSEGAVRRAAAESRPVPCGWLVDAEWNDVIDPRRLYLAPPSAFLAPLGGRIAGYKGFALATAAEIMAGIVPPGQFAGPACTIGGNGAMFVTMDAAAMGRDIDAVVQDVEALMDYLTSLPVAPGADAIRVPGRSESRRRLPHSMTLPRPLWETILRLASVGGTS